MIFGDETMKNREGGGGGGELICPLLVAVISLRTQTYLQFGWRVTTTENTAAFAG